MFDYMKTVIDLYFPSQETDELEGQGMVEYGLILALVSVVAIAVLILVGEEVANIFSTVQGYLQGGS